MITKLKLAQMVALIDTIKLCIRIKQNNREKHKDIVKFKQPAGDVRGQTKSRKQKSYMITKLKLAQMVALIDTIKAADSVEIHFQFTIEEVYAGTKYVYAAFYALPLLIVSPFVWEPNR